MMKRIWMLGIAALIIAGCSKNESGLGQTQYSMVEIVSDDATLELANLEEIPILPEQSIEIAPSVEGKGKKIIKDGYMNLQVSALSSAKQRIDSLVRKYDGYYRSEAYYDHSTEINYDLNIRVPAASFEKLVAAIETGKDKVRNKNISARDVTEQYTDIEIRLANKRAYLKRYQELVKQAKTVKDVLDIEERIRGLEEEIESTEGRLQSLSDQIAYSTLSLSIFQKTEYKFTSTPQAKFTERVKTALVKGWHGVVNFFLGLIYIWPFLVLIGTGLFVWLRRRKKKK